MEQEYVNKSEAQLGDVMEYAKFKTYFGEGGQVVQMENLYKDFSLEHKKTIKQLGLERALHNLTQIRPVPQRPTVNQGRFSDKELKKLLIDHGVAIRSAAQYLHLPAMRDYDVFGPFPSEEVRNSKLKELKENERVTVDVKAKDTLYIVVAFPSPAFSKGTRIPKYSPTFRAFGSNRQWLVNMHTNLINAVYGSKDNSIQAVKIYHDMLDIFTKWIECSGTLEGMVNRFSIMKKVAKEAAEIRKDNTISVEALIELIRRWLPKDPNVRLFNLDTPDLRILIQSKVSVENDEGEPELKEWNFKLNRDANSGVMWNGVLDRKLTKGETFMVDLQFATNMMIKLDAEYEEFTGTKSFLSGKFSGHHEEFVRIAGGNDEWKYRRKLTKEQVMEKFWMVYKFILLFNMFPKTDPYVVEDLEKKTRIIAGRGTGETLPASPLLTPFLDNLRTFVDVGPCWYIPGKGLSGGSMSMLKVSPFLGNFDIIYGHFKELVTKPEGSCVIYIFADNIMVGINYGGEVVFASLDFVKAESTISKEDVLAANLAALRSYPKVTQCWLLYATEVLPALAVNGVGVLGNQELNYTFLSSGTTGTHYYNSVQAVRNVDTITNIHKPSEEHNPFYNWENRSLSKAVKMAHLITGSELEEEVSSRWDLKPTTEPIPMGIIGFDMVTLEIEPGEHVAVAILQYERLLKLLVLNKSYHDENGNPTKDAYTMAYLELVKMRAAMTMGAWYYPPLRRDVFHAAVQAQKKLMNVISATETKTEVEYSTVATTLRKSGVQDEWIPSLIGLINGTAIPTMFEVFRILIGDKKKAFRAIEARVGIAPISHLVSYEQWKEFRKDPESVGLQPRGENPEIPDFHEEYMDYDVHRVYNKGGGSTLITVKEMLSPASISKLTEIGNTKLEERSPVTNVGRPYEPPTPFSSIRRDNEAGVLKIRKFIDLFSPVTGYFTIYRIPIPEDRIVDLGNVKNERKVAYLTLFKLLQTVSRCTDATIFGMIKNLLPHTLFIIRPWTLETGGEKEVELLSRHTVGTGLKDAPLLNWKTDSMFETTRVPLKEGLFVDRKLDEKSHFIEVPDKASLGQTKLKEVIVGPSGFEFRKGVLYCTADDSVVFNGKETIDYFSKIDTSPKSQKAVVKGELAENKAEAKKEKKLGFSNARVIPTNKTREEILKEQEAIRDKEKQKPVVKVIPGKNRTQPKTKTGFGQALSNQEALKILEGISHPTIVKKTNLTNEFPQIEAAIKGPTGQLYVPSYEAKAILDREQAEKQAARALAKTKFATKNEKFRIGKENAKKAQKEEAEKQKEVKKEQKYNKNIKEMAKKKRAEIKGKIRGK